MSGRWRNPRLWQVAGIVATMIWLTHVAQTTGFDPAHPLFSYIFIVPLAGWVVLTLLIRWLGRPPSPPDGT